MEEKVEGLLTYILGWITGIIFLLLEKKSKFVKFHAAQSTVVFLALDVAYIIFIFIPIIGWILAWLTGILGFILWIVLMVKAYQGEMWEVPYTAEWTKKLLAKF